MPVHRFELLVGTIDGVNKVFTTTVPYTAGSVAVYDNGILQFHASGNPWTETDPSTGTVTLEFAPKPGDQVAASYFDTTPTVPETEVTELCGELCPVDDLTGTLNPEALLAGSLSETDDLDGTLNPATELEGTLDEVDFLEGVLEVCD